MRKLVLYLLLYPTLLGLLCLKPSIVHANSLATDTREILFSDDFSQGLEKWEDTQGTFDLWSNPAGAAEALIPRRSTTAELVPKDAYWDPSWQDVVITFEYTTLKGADKNIAFWVQDKYNWYGLHFTSGAVHLSDVQNGKVVWSYSDWFGMSYGKKYAIELQLNQGHIVLLIDGQKIIDQVSPQFKTTTGKFALRAGAGSAFPTQVRFDSVVVRSYQERQLENQQGNITPLKQIDSRWAELEYDSTQLWSPDKNTIADWGCLLTSLVMVLEHHDITFFPDGSKINPPTLNQWLLSQPDGYIGDGLINIPSVMRLVREISTAFGTTKLEYQKHIGSDIAGATQYLDNNLPAILEVVGHFFVGTTYAYTNTGVLDISIIDPYYPYTLLSQHNKPIVSTRSFTPSMTDLSYIILAANPKLLVTITTDELGTTPENYTSTIEKITATTEQLNTPSLLVHEVAKPAAKEFFITIESSQPLEKDALTLFIYDAAGNMRDLSLKNIPTHTTSNSIEEPLYVAYFVLDYATDIQKSTLAAAQKYDDTKTPQLTFSELLEKLRIEHKLYKKYVQTELEWFWGQVPLNTRTELQQQRIHSGILELVQRYAVYISTEGQSEIREYMER